MGPRMGLEDVERRKILPLPGLELRPLGRPARSSVAILTALPRLKQVLLVPYGRNTQMTILFTQYYDGD
jgi:hypothetical protein